MHSSFPPHFKTGPRNEHSTVAYFSATRVLQMQFPFSRRRQAAERHFGDWAK